MTTRTKVFFGPPGAGKSTLIHLARRSGLEAFDLEAAPRSLRAVLVFRANEATSPLRQLGAIGAADAQPSSFDPRFYTRVLLLPPRATYDRRRTRRDILYPHKRGQPDVYDAFRADMHKFDMLIDVYDAEDNPTLFSS